MNLPNGSPLSEKDLRRYFTRRQTNDILRRLETAGLDPGDFDWVLTSQHQFGSNLPTLLHRPTEYYCRIHDTGMSWRCAFSPAGDKIALTISSGASARPGEDKFESFLNTQFSAWLRYLKADIDLPDLWLSALEESGNLSLDEDESLLVPFTEAERRQIGVGLDAFVATVRSSALPLREDAQTYLEQEAIYLKEASGRLTKKDWKAILVSVLVNVCVGAMLDAEQARLLFEFAKNALKQLHIALPL